MENGDVLAGRYRLERVLGRGGMGAVWLGRDETVLDRDVAVKVLYETSADPTAARRFQKEAATLAGLQHPGITVVHDAGSHEGHLFLVMELLHGADLARLVARHPQGLPLDTVLDLSRQTAEALAVAHGRGVIHRDPAAVRVAAAARGGTCAARGRPAPRCPRRAGRPGGEQRRDMAGWHGKRLSSMSTVAFSPDGRLLASGGSGPVRLWDLRSGALHQALRSGSDDVNDLVFSPNGKTLAGVSDGHIFAWDTDTGERLLSLMSPRSPFRSLAFSPDGRTLASAAGTWADSMGELCLWTATP